MWTAIDYLILKEYEAGRMMSGELKGELISVLQQLVSGHQEKRKTITDEVVTQYMTPRNLNLIIYFSLHIFLHELHWLINFP